MATVGVKGLMIGSDNTQCDSPPKAASCSDLLTLDCRESVPVDTSTLNARTNLFHHGSNWWSTDHVTYKPGTDLHRPMDFCRLCSVCMELVSALLTFTPRLKAFCVSFVFHSLNTKVTCHQHVWNYNRIMTLKFSHYYLHGHRVENQ